jgi:hypothetical protein
MLLRRPLDKTRTHPTNLPEPGIGQDQHFQVQITKQVSGFCRYSASLWWNEGGDRRPRALDCPAKNNPPGIRAEPRNDFLLAVHVGYILGTHLPGVHVAQSGKLDIALRNTLLPPLLLALIFEDFLQGQTKTGHDCSPDISLYIWKKIRFEDLFHCIRACLRKRRHRQAGLITDAEPGIVIGIPEAVSQEWFEAGIIPKQLGYFSSLIANGPEPAYTVNFAAIWLIMPFQ